MSFEDELCRTVAESADRLVWAQVFMSGRGRAHDAPRLAAELPATLGKHK